MKIIFTGGHFSPAYAVIKRIQKEHNVAVIGRRYAFEGHQNETLEYLQCKKDKIPFFEINAGRLQRKFTKYSAQSVVKFPNGVIQAIKILRDQKPDVVVTFGGYVGLPIAIASYVLRIPVVLHEQTQKAGLSSKIIGRFASKILISFDSSIPYFPKHKTVLTGNPIREEIFQKRDIKKFHTTRPLIYITGGSTGAHAINMTVSKILPDLTSNYFVVHQTGSQDTNDFENLVNLRAQLTTSTRENYIVEKFFSPIEVAYLFQNASLVVSRAGINTVTELLALGTVALLIPLQYGQQNEQKDNAMLMSSTGLGEYLLQENITAQKLLEKMRDMIKEQKNYKKHAQNALKYIHKDAVDKIIEQIYFYGRRKEGNLDSPEKKEGILI